MTTPAIDRATRRYRDQLFSLKIGNSLIINKRNDGTRSVMSALHQRPESISTVKSGDGYRPPTPWRHDRFIQPEFLPLVDWHGMIHPLGGQIVTEIYEDVAPWSFGGFPSIPFPTSELEGRAINGALEKLKNQKANLGVMFGERKATARMFSDLVSGIAKEIRNFKRRNPKDWARVLRSKPRRQVVRGGNILRDGRVSDSIPSNWLALQYGWKPAMSEFYGSIEALANREMDGDRYSITVTKMVSNRYIRKFQRIFDTAGYDLVWKSRTDHGVYVSLTYQLDNPLVRSLASSGVTNPLEIIWELVPYSFVLDWALPIGEWLGLLDADFGWQYRGGSLSRLSKDIAIVDSLVKARNGTYYPDRQAVRVTGLEQLRYKNVGFRRIVLESSPTPRIYYKNPLSLGHVANATALLATALNR